MFSTLTLVSVFLEIFAAGILFSGGLTFFKISWTNRRWREALLGLTFISLFVYVATALSLQLMYNLGRPLQELILIQKTETLSLIFSSLWLWLYLVERYEIRRWHILSFLITLFSGWMVWQVATAAVSLVYREEVIEPIVNFSAFIPAKPLFFLVWVLLLIFSFGAGLSSKGGRRRLALLTGWSAALFLAALISSFFYLRFGEAGYLLASWGFMLLSILGILLGELIPPDSEEALAPLRFLRTRILFKLMLIFVLLIVILFEATTLATINISKNALSRHIQATYLQEAEGLARKLESLPSLPTMETLHRLLGESRLTERSTVFVVNAQGELLYHPDQKRALQREKMLANEGVLRLLKGERGAGEFNDELGSRVVGAYLPLPRFGWGIVVEEPITSAYFELRRVETNSLLFVIAGIILTALTGVFFARSIEKPIQELIAGTEAVARGELGYRISVGSTDEIGRLARAFNQMTKEMRDSQERLILSEKLASLGTMAAGMAHEIKNPLVSLRTFTQLMQQKWEDKEFREKFASIIPLEIERINRIAESLLKFGRPMKPELTQVDVNSLLDEVLLLFESECKKYNIRVTKKFATLPQISGDAGQLSQAFVNIIKNGIEAMQEKGGELLVKTDLGEVVKLGKINRQGVKQGEEMVWGEEEELLKPTPVVFIEVTDTGEGISEENLKSLFDPFFTTKMTGTGMGLPITLRIIDEHKGSIKVRSRPQGKMGQGGTTFIITLPQKLA